MIRTEVILGVAQPQLDQRLADIENNGGTVVSVSVGRIWEGWYKNSQMIRMDVLIVCRDSKRGL